MARSGAFQARFLVRELPLDSVGRPILTGSGASD